MKNYQESSRQRFEPFLSHSEKFVEGSMHYTFLWRNQIKQLLRVRLKQLTSRIIEHSNDLLRILTYFSKSSNKTENAYKTLDKERHRGSKYPLFALRNPIKQFLEVQL